MEISAEIRDLYEDVERSLMPTIRARASRLRGVDLDDAIQEARIAILAAMSKYDYTKARGELQPYLRAVITNTCHDLYARSVQLQRMPRVAVQDGDGWKLAPVKPMSIELLVGTPVLEQAEADGSVDVELEYSQRQSAQRVASFRVALESRLGERERQILSCKLEPPSELSALAMAAGRDCPSNVDIAKHLGLNKAKIDWALYKVRNVFTELAGEEQFSDLFGEHIRGSGWPSVSICQGLAFDEQFVENTIQSRGLHHSQPRCVEAEECDLGRREVRWYGWGAVVGVWRDGRVWTAVVEGAFNPRSGEATGVSGARKLLPIEGYAMLSRELSEARRGITVQDEDLKVLPRCVGDHEAGNETCEGDGTDEPPCAHRDTCVALQLRMREKGLSVVKYLESKVDLAGQHYNVPIDLEKFGKIIRQQIKHHQIRNGKSAKAKGRRPQGSSLGAKSAPGAKLVAPRMRSEQAPRTAQSISMDSWYERWLEIILEGTKRTMAATMPEVGELYLMDRRPTSGYLGLYCRPGQGRPIPLGYLHYKPRNELMDMKFPVGPGQFSGVGMKTLKALHPEAHRDGVWLSIARNLDQTKVAMGGEVIAHMVREGIICLPDV